MTRAATRRAYIQRMKKRVGLLNAGWLGAAQQLKTAKRATPGWITRHGRKPGGVSLTRGRTGLVLRIYNRLPWFPKDMPARVARAVRWRTNGLEKALEAMIERKAKRANARMNR